MSVGDNLEPFRILGNSELKVFPIGLGCMGMSEYYGATDVSESIKSLEAAIDLGVNFFDTADAYGRGSNEELLAPILKKYRDRMILATKGGIHRTDQHNPRYINCTPTYIRKACEASLRRLRIETIDLYYLHRVDPLVPIEETIGELSRLIQEGKVRYIGLCEASTRILKRAYSIHPITALQTEYSLFSRDVEEEILPFCREQGISLVAYSPLGRGILSGGIRDPAELEKDDCRRKMPRFSDSHFENNRDILVLFFEMADQIGCTPSQLALSWLLHRDERVVPIPGTKRTKFLIENVGAFSLGLTKEDFKRVDRLFQPGVISGERYSDAAMESITRAY